MKKAALFLMAAVAATSLFAQTLNVSEGNVTYVFNASGMGDAVFSGGDSFEILGRTFSVANVSGMVVDSTSIDDNTVNVAYNGTSANVTIAGNIAKYVSATVDGAHVSIIQSSETESESGEITYSLSGESSDGGFYMEGSYKATIELRELTLTNPSGAAIDIQNGKRIEMSAKSGTVNTLTDGTNGSQKGALVCKGHLELKGKGTLNVAGNTAHAIYAKEYVEMKNLTVNITSSVKDGINCAQYFLMESGELNLSGIGDDGIQIDYKDDTDRDVEDTGSATIKGGTINIAVTAAAAKGIKAEGDVTIDGGNITISATGKGKWDSDDKKTKAASCLNSDANMVINDGTLNLTATGSGGKGLSCDGTLTINGGSTTIKTSGGVFAYVNNKEYDGYTGNTDNLKSDYKSSPKGMKVDTSIEINGGAIDVTTTGKGGEGIESKGTLTINDGTILVNSYDDGINSSSHMYIKGGDITVVATNNDGLDSNGNLYIQGGYIRAFGATSPECGIDANEEGGYSVYFTGGTLLSVGGGNATPSSTSSTQAFVSGSGTVKADTTIELKSGDTVLATFTVPSNYSSGNGGGGWGGSGSSCSILITCPDLESGSSYTLVNNGSSSNVTAKLKGSSSGGGGGWH